ncbi:MAG: leucine--tRNA ligase [Chloroflexi bacterium]|nr:leucine--tRNA ligase [Chloroflexota bacterium]MBP7041430.1 leucine--tRNA ligase [Chloroflexota bacterium]
MTTKPNRQAHGRYPFPAIEAKWRPYWQANDLYQTGHDPAKPDVYILDFFPYPSGDGLSVGHGRNYVPTCVSSRFMRMNGRNVLHPMGWDAFGLPAENYAIRHGIHPRQSSAQFSATYKRQMQLLECSYDWSREFSSTDPAYYRWTQWFFLLLFKRGLAYRAPGSQWWCPQCQTILANEQVEDGRCWRCGTPVVKKELDQWYFKITAYADRLLADLDTVDWPEAIKIMQRNWIGRSEGAEVLFDVADCEPISVFTTRPDTLFGVTFLALAPEHPLVNQITTPEWETAVAQYAAQTQQRSDIDRQSTEQEKTGVFTGAYASHPLHGGRIPIWVADYVLPGYGSGAVMGVPAHDTRDFAFAHKYDLPIVEVVCADGTAQGTAVCHTAPGVMIHSGPYSGQTSAAGGAAIVADLAVQGQGQPQTSYKIRDWLISRQRYWGAPIPIVHCPACGPVAVPEDQLPVLLPDTTDFAPAGDGRSPLARIDEWVQTTCPQCAGPARRETDTMDGFACSSWYFLRFPNPQYDEGPFDPTAVRRWLPVETYVGGAEHAVMHLLYARFWTKVMADAGLIDFVEPFTQLRNQGILLAASDGRRMSKSRGNVVTPDAMIARYGTDALRAYLLFLGPFDAEVTWDEAGIRGVTRFLDKFWRLAGGFNTEAQRRGEEKEDAGFERRRHQVIQRVTGDMAEFRFNTAVAALMEYLNYLTDYRDAAISAAQWRRTLESFTLLLAPICPFISEEVWQTSLGHGSSVHRQAWPRFDEALTVAAQVTLPVQVNGKVRDRIVVAVDAAADVVGETAVSAPGVQRHVNGRAIQQLIIVPNKLVNIVVG